jgi:L-serine deaminase
VLEYAPRLSLSRNFSSTKSQRTSFDDEPGTGTYSESDHEHAVISTFDLFSIGIGPSSSHTVGPMRAGNIFVADLLEAGILPKVDRIRVALYGSLALTGEGHMTPSALLLGLESADVETVDTAYVPERFEQIKKDKKLFLGHQLPDGKGKEIAFDFERDFKWEWGRKLPLHSNGMRLMVFDKEGYMLATNDLFSVGGGFVVNGALSINSADSDSSSAKDAGQGLSTETHGGHPTDLAENMFYKEIRRDDAAGDRRTGSEIKPVGDTAALLPSSADGGHALPPVTSSTEDAPMPDGVHGHQPRYPFRDANSLLALCDKHNLTIAQLVYENEKSHGYTDEEIRSKLFRIWEVMDNSILQGVQAPPDSTLPGSLKLHRRAPALYRRLTRGLYPSHTTQGSSEVESAQAQLPSENKALSSGSLESGSSSMTTASSASSSGRKDVALKRAGPLRTHGSFSHPVLPSPRRRTTFPASK